MPRVLVNVMSSERSDRASGQITSSVQMDRPPYWGLGCFFDSHDEVRCLLRIRPGIQFVDSGFRIADRLGATALPDPGAFWRSDLRRGGECNPGSQRRDAGHPILG